MRMAEAPATSRRVPRTPLEKAAAQVHKDNAGIVAYVMPEDHQPRENDEAKRLGRCPTPWWKVELASGRCTMPPRVDIASARMRECLSGHQHCGKFYPAHYLHDDEDHSLICADCGNEIRLEGSEAWFWREGVHPETLEPLGEKKNPNEPPTTAESNRDVIAECGASFYLDQKRLYAMTRTRWSTCRRAKLYPGCRDIVAGNDMNQPDDLADMVRNVHQAIERYAEALQSHGGDAAKIYELLKSAQNPT
jgi:hypothetical protein